MRISKVLLFTAFLGGVAALPAQQLQLTSNGVTSFVPGNSYMLSVVLTGTQGNVVAIEDKITATPTLTVMSVTADPAVNNKSNVCSPAVPNVCVLIGVVPAPTIVQGSLAYAAASVFNDIPIPDNTKVQDILVTIPTTVMPGSSIIFTVDTTFAVDPNGAAISLSGSVLQMPVATPISLAQLSLSTWAANPTSANFLSLVASIITAQQQVGK